MRPRFSLAFILLIMFNMTVARAAAASLATLNGSYLLDHRPHALMLLTLTQDGTALNGSMLSAAADGQGGTINTISSLSGSMVDGAFTLTASQQANGLALAGRLKGSSAEVSFTSKSGQTLTVQIAPVTQAQFNKYLGAWTRQMTKDYAAEHKAAQKPAPAVAAPAAPPKPGINDEVQIAEAALVEAKRSLAALVKALDNLKREVAAKPASSCPQLQPGVEAIYAKEMNPAYKNDFGGSIGALRRAVMHLQKLLAKAEDDKTVRKAREAIPGWKSQENTLVAEANGIMKEAKGIVAGASCG